MKNRVLFVVFVLMNLTTLFFLTQWLIVAYTTINVLAFELFLLLIILLLTNIKKYVTVKHK